MDQWPQILVCVVLGVVIGSMFRFSFDRLRNRVKALEDRLGKSPW